MRPCRFSTFILVAFLATAARAELRELTVTEDDLSRIWRRRAVRAHPCGAIRYSAEHARFGIPHTLAVYAGDHRSELRERLEHFVLPMVSRQFER